MRIFIIILLGLLLFIPLQASILIENFRGLQLGDSTISLQPLWLINDNDTSISPWSDTDSVLIGGTTTSSAEFVFDVWSGIASSTATTTAQGFKGKNLIDCNTIDTDSEGDFVCGTDAGASGTAAWEALFTNTLAPTNTSAGIFVYASSTIDGDLTVIANSLIQGGATTTDVHHFGVIEVSDDYISDFAGTGLSVTSGVLNAEVQTSDLHAAVTLAGEDYLSLSTQEITAIAINPDNLANTDFGDFTCNGTNCSIDASVIGPTEIDLTANYSWTGLHDWNSLAVFTGDIRANHINATTSVFDSATTTDTLAIGSKFKVAAGSYISSLEGTGLSVSGGTLNAHVAVTLAGTPNYLTLSTQQITLAKLDINDDTNATGGTGITISTNDFTFDCSEVEGVGIDCSGENITLDATGDWTGTFDGFQATSFLRSDANDTATGLLILQGGIVVNNPTSTITVLHADKIMASTTVVTTLNISDDNFTDLVGDATLSFVSGTLRVVDLNCTNCLGQTEIVDDYLLNTGDTGTGLYVFTDLRSATINSTTTNIDTLTVNTTINVPAGSIDFSDDTNATAGDGITFTNDSIAADLGTAIVGSEITDGTIEEVDLEVTNAPTDNYILSVDTASGGFTWVPDDTGSGAGSAWESFALNVLAPTNTSAGIFVFASSTVVGNFTNIGNLLTQGKSTSTLSLWIGIGGVAGSLNMTGGDLYVQDDVEIDGTLTVADAQITGGAITGITDIIVADGGTGVSSLTDGGVLIGSGTSAITALSVGSNGQLLIGSSAADPVFATLTCDTNLTCTTGAGTLEIDVDDAFLLNNGDTGTGAYIFSGDVRAATINSTTTNIDTLTVNTNLIIDSQTFDSFTDDATLSNNSGDLRVVDLNCTNCIGQTEIVDDYLLIAGDSSSGNYTWTGAHIFSGATLEIPNGTAPTVNAIGEMALDITSNNLIIATSTGADAGVVFASATSTLYSFALASTSLELVSGGVLELPSHWLPQHVIGVICSVDADALESVVINLSDTGTNDTNTVTCITTSLQYNFTSNNDFTAYEDIRLEVGTVTADVDYLTVRFIGYRLTD